MSEYYSYWILQTIAMLLTALVLPGLRVTSILGALITVLLLAFVNATIWDAALFFQIPDTFNAHTVLLLVCNAALFWLLVKIVPGIEMSGIFISIIAPLVFTVFSVLINVHAKDVQWGSLVRRGLGQLEQFRDSMMQQQSMLDGFISSGLIHRLDSDVSGSSVSSTRLNMEEQK